MFSLIYVRPEHSEQLYNLLQNYLGEMSECFGVEPDEKGEYPYPYFNSYFAGSNDRKAYIIYDNNVEAGFVMLNKHSVLEQEIDHSIAEFYIKPEFRRTHLGEDIFLVLCKQFKGVWELKYNVDNIPAVKFWSKVTAPHSPEITKLNDKEEVLTYTVK